MYVSISHGNHCLVVFLEQKAPDIADRTSCTIADVFTGKRCLAVIVCFNANTMQ